MIRLGEPAASSRWFLRRGLASLTEGTPAYRSASQRAAPALVVIFVVVMLSMVPEASANLPVSLGIASFAVLVTWVGGNLLRRSPPFSGVDRIGWGERAVFVLVPVLTVLLAPHEEWAIDEFTLTASESRWYSALGLAVTQAVILAVVMFMVGYGVVALSVFLSRELIRALAVAGDSLTRALPLLLAFITFSYFASELWQSVGRLDSWAFLGITGLFVGLSAIFLASRHHLDLADLSSFQTREEWADALRRATGDPAPRLPSDAGFPLTCPLPRRQQANLRLVATLSRLVGVTMVGGAVFVVLVVVGVLVVSPELVKAWGGGDPDVLLQWSTSRRTYLLCWENLRVSGFLGVFSAFYFAITSASDATLRTSLYDSAHDLVRQACAVRTYLLAQPAPGSAHPGGDAELLDDLA
jgi:hypothetical protein